jgi:hypothetical protein
MLAACSAGAVATGRGEAPGPAPTAPIRVENYGGGETVRFPVVLLGGRLSDASATSVTVVNTSSRRDTRQLTGLARGGRFKALAELVPGANRLVLRAGKHQLPLRLTYKPQTNPYVVRAVYFTDASGDTTYQTPLADDPQDYRGKLDTAMKLMQTFTAERMHDAGLGRATFNLELDGEGKVKVHVLRGRRPAEYYHKLSGSRLYSEVGRELARKLPHRRAKSLVIPAMTRFDPNTGKAYAHTALGGGNLALFGGGDLFTWPNRLGDAQMAFLNEARVDPKKLFSDSVGRHTFWAIASTTMGAALHELGHTFGLPHSRKRHDIMTRGHDRWNRFFTLVEPPHARRNRPYAFRDDEVAEWAPVSAAALAPIRHFALDERAWRDERATTIRLDRPSKSLVIESARGVRYIGVMESGPRYGTEAIGLVAPGRGPGPIRKVTVPLADVRRAPRNGRISLKVIDGEGLTTTTGLTELLAGPYVQQWRFADAFPAWRDARSFVEVDAARLKAIAASAAKAPLRRSKTPFVDFLAVSGSRRSSQVAGYAARTIHADRARKIRLHTGSDDALRMWLNGKLIASVLALRSAQADTEATDAELRKGANVLIVEVSQGLGGWGLILRITDADGTKLELTEAGRLRKAD